MARYMIETEDHGYPVIIITADSEHWEDILESLDTKDKVYPLDVSVPNIRLNHLSTRKLQRRKGRRLCY